MTKHISSCLEKHSIDIAVGNRIRQFRTQQKMTQETLAKKIGVSFQQVQKYETAGNRISASRLYDITQILKISMVDFCRDASISGKQNALSEKSLSIAIQLDNIKSDLLREKISQLIDSCSENL